MKSKNILIICPFFRPNIGGVETHLDLLTKYLVSQKHKITVLTYKPLTTKSTDYKKIEKSKNLIIYRYWWFGQKTFDKTTPYPFLQFLYIVPKLLFHTLKYLYQNHKKIDVIHAHGFAAASITKISCLFFPVKKTIVSTHYLYPNLNIKNLSTKLLKSVFDSFDQILLVSQQSGKQLQKIGISSSKMVKYQHWIDSSVYKPSNKKNKNFSILFVGRIIKSKGIFRLLQATKKLPRDFQFTVIGDGPDFNKLKQESLNQANFHLIGKKNPIEIIPYYQSHHLTILPSITPEAQPLTIMESLMCGTPIITTNLGSVVDMYPNTVGFKINPSINNIVKTIKYCSLHPGQIKIMSGLARKFAINNFSSKNANTIEQSYL